MIDHRRRRLTALVLVALLMLALLRPIEAASVRVDEAGPFEVREFDGVIRIGS